MKTRKYPPALLIVALLIANVAAAPRVTILNQVFVAPGGLTSGSCDSWANACDLQYALTVASGDFTDDEMWVKQGTYTPTTGIDRTISFALQNGVSIYGGFAGTETTLTERNWGTHVTILSGDIGAVGTATDNSYHVVTGGGTDNTAILDGFTITGGNANGTAVNDYSWGGGIYTDYGSPTLADLIIAGNHARQYGGGMTSYGKSPTLTNVEFNGNTADPGSGGGIYNMTSSPTLTNVTFDANKSKSDAGGMYNFGSSPTLTNVTFTGNSAGNRGGAIFNEIGNASLVNVTFRGNSAQFEGGALFNMSSNPVITNVTFSGNQAGAAGGAVLDDGMSSPTINDSILWNDGSEIADLSGAPTLSDSIVAGGCPYNATCKHVINGNPELVSLHDNGGFTETMALGAGSAAIDAGGTHAACAAKDQRGVARPQGGKCDIGAYEVRAKTFRSAGTYDGWVLESGENTSIGGSLNSTGATLRLGDDSSNRQYRSVISFGTSGIPDAATVVLARVKVKKQGLIGTDPFTTHGKLTLDLKKPFFGSVIGLELGDFQAAATTSPAGSIGSTLVSGWYAGLLNNAGLGSVNKTGTTQLRLRFTTDDNNDNSADYLSLYSGNASTASYRPVLMVYYNP